MLLRFVSPPSPLCVQTCDEEGERVKEGERLGSEGEKKTERKRIISTGHKPVCQITTNQRTKEGAQHQNALEGRPEVALLTH